ncbi:NADH dehydrogenase [ubiquinone] 1 alpha subcomplex subunit 7-like [Lytechinus variegatus]|uniref:NADH dehydrogenase [ubiquinone] 1 alpha subcomplex subunit 7-like n=1 Tax=Lytechinus variegatus TaxID=7654 RepID=UPI001BB28088|nr:NADH dehydrogenase [ubiquinone] 1 alpha subcomplex subunit 7-like [Lytechinus variegatus]
MATASRFIQRLRNFFAGRDLQAHLNNRYAYGQSPRTQPDPVLPEGPSHRLSANYYCSRDGRRESQRPVHVFSATQRLPAPQSQEEGESAVGPALKKPVIPGPPPPAMKLSTDEPYL